jgi:hypothetical protein
MGHHLGGLGCICASVCLWFVAHPPREEGMNPIVVFLIGIAVIVLIVGAIIVWKDRKKPT